MEELTKQYIAGFRQAISEQGMTDTDFDKVWNRLTEKIEPDHIESLTFQILQRASFIIWSRHILPKLHKDITLAYRISSWENYKILFDLLLDAKIPVRLTLPIDWSWEIIDEFVYQFQEFSQFSSKTKDLSIADITLLKGNSVWNVVQTLKYLQRIVQKSEVKQTLENEKLGLSVKKSAFANSDLYHSLGYWSLIGLCKIHVLLGDYYLAVKTMDPIKIHSKAKYTQVSSAYVAVHYHLGFSFLMLRRYHDAIEILTGILLYIGRAKKVQTTQYDQSKYDCMYALLAILLTLLPTQIDEHVHYTLQTEHSDKVIASQRDMEQLFSYSCPKFVSPVPPTYDEEEVFVHTNAPLPLQRKVFMKEIDQQTALPTIMSYLRLYSSIGLDKFVTLLDKKMNTQMLRTHLLCLSHKSFQRVITPGSNLSEGVRESSTYQQFWLEGDMVHIVDRNAEKKYGEIFLNNTNSIINAVMEIKKQKV